MKIPITKPVFDDKEKQAIVKPLETGWVVQGPNVGKFEKLFAEFAGSKYAIATTSCTTALHMSLEALGLGKGDKVIVPSFTFIASANAVEYTGAEVVFCDIDLRTFNLNVEQVENILKKDTTRTIKCIMPVDLFGLCADMTQIIEIAEKYQVKIVEDSACGFSSFIGEKHAGTFGDTGCFSFHPRKVISTGEGGMVITDNDEIAAKLYALRDHGASKSDLQRHKEKGGELLPDFSVRGYNYRMTDFQGALGVCQMEKATFITTKRSEIARRYNDVLSKNDALITPFVPEGFTHGYQSYVCLFTRGENINSLNMETMDRLHVERNEFMAKLGERGIATRQGTHAVHTLNYYQKTYDLKSEDFLQSYAADRLTITLPLYAEMTEAEFNYVIKNIEELLST